MTKVAYDVDDLLTKVGFTKQDIAKVKKGYVVNSVNIETLSDRDLATIIAFEFEINNNTEETGVNANDDDIDDAFERAFLESPHKIESDSTIQQMVVDINRDGNLDFSSVKLLPKESTDDMVQSYMTFQGGSELNLSQKEIDMFQAIDNNHPDPKGQVEMVLGKVLQGRLEEYQHLGLEGISPYLRKGGKCFYPGKELQEKTEKNEILHQPHVKEFSDYILNWPSSSSTSNGNNNNSDNNSHAKETYGWINYNIDDKPSIALYHRIIWSDEANTIKFLLSRTFYVSKGHNSVQQIGFAIPTGDTSILLAFSSRTSTDAVTGFGGSAKRVIGSRIMSGRIAENFEALRKLSASKK